MRFVLPLALASFATLTAAPALAAEEDRYGGGGDASTYDFSGFDKLPSSSSAAGGYRSPASSSSNAAQPSASLPSSSQAAPRPSQPSSSAGFPSSSSPTGSASMNELRQPSSPQASSGQLPSSSVTLPPRNTGIVPSSQSQATLPGSSRPLSASPPTTSQPASNFPSSSSLNSSATQSAPRPSDPYANTPPSPSAGFGGSNPATRPSESGLRPSNNFSSQAGSSTDPGSDFRSNPQATAGSQNSFQQPNRATTSQPSVTQPPRQQFTDSSVLNSRVGGASDPLASSREQTTHDLLRRMLTPRPESQLSGTPMTLASAIASAEGREAQAQRVEAYWALTSAVADYYMGLAEIAELSGLRQQLATYNNTLGEAEVVLKTRVDTSLKAARAAQSKLSYLVGSSAMPLPSDIPFTGPYATRFESVFAGGAPAEARLIAELLPLRLAELQDAANSVSHAQLWVKQVAADQTAQSNGTGVLRAQQLLALNRRAFIQIARDYNVQINRYSQLATPDHIDTGRLVAMLIRTAPTSAVSADDAMIAGFSAGSNNSASRPPEPNAPARR